MDLNTLTMGIIILWYSVNTIVFIYNINKTVSIIRIIINASITIYSVSINTFLYIKNKIKNLIFKDNSSIPYSDVYIPLHESTYFNNYYYTHLNNENDEENNVDRSQINVVVNH